MALRRIVAYFVILFCTVFIASSTQVFSLDVPPSPSLGSPVVDTSKTLSEQEIEQIAGAINASRQDKSYQLAVLMISTLEGRAIEDYSLEVARKWGVGEKVNNNGVLLLVAKNDKKMRIEVGRGVEGNLTDVQAGRIIRNVMAPQFRQGNFSQGIIEAIEVIQNVMDGKEDSRANEQVASLEEVISTIGFASLFGISWLAAILARSKSWWAGGVIGAVIGLVICLFAGWALVSVIGLIGLIIGGLGLDYAVSKNYKKHVGHGSNAAWWAGGSWPGGGHNGHGGGGSFGGGGFGGGGASGGW